MSEQIARPFAWVALVVLCWARTLPCQPIRHARLIVVPHRIPLRRQEPIGTTDWTGKRSKSAGTCVQQPDARTNRLRSCPPQPARGAGSVGANTYSRRPSDVTKPRRSHSTVATSQNVCPQGNLCARFGRDNR